MSFTVTLPYPTRSQLHSTCCRCFTDAHLRCPIVLLSSSQYLTSVPNRFQASRTRHDDVGGALPSASLTKLLFWDSSLSLAHSHNHQALPLPGVAASLSVILLIASQPTLLSVFTSSGTQHALPLPTKSLLRLIQSFCYTTHLPRQHCTQLALSRTQHSTTRAVLSQNPLKGKPAILSQPLFSSFLVFLRTTCAI